jgi:hypothetical protein
MEKVDQVIFAFTMPFNESLEIRKAILSNGNDHYMIFWEDLMLPTTSCNEVEAINLAIGCQWGAFEMQKKMLKVKTEN